MQYYVALVHKDAESDFGVSFPDFPGCVTAGRTLAEAASLAAEALAGHIDVMSEGAHDIPEPSTLEVIMADQENADGVPVLVPAIVRKPSRAIRINITMPEDVLKRIDAFAAQRGMNRSGFLARAAVRAIEAA